jgi:hypothetical protein
MYAPEVFFIEDPLRISPQKSTLNWIVDPKSEAQPQEEVLNLARGREEKLQSEISETEMSAITENLSICLARLCALRKEVSITMRQLKWS